MDVKVTWVPDEQPYDGWRVEVYLNSQQQPIADSGILSAGTTTYIATGGVGQHASHIYRRYQGQEYSYDSLDGLTNKVQNSSGNKAELLC